MIVHCIDMTFKTWSGREGALEWSTAKNHVGLSCEAEQRSLIVNYSVAFTLLPVVNLCTNHATRPQRILLQESKRIVEIMKEKIFLACTLRSVDAYSILRCLLWGCSVWIVLMLLKSSVVFFFLLPRRRARFNNVSVMEFCPVSLFFPLQCTEKCVIY